MFWTRKSKQNLLIRHLQRHARVSVLFGGAPALAEDLNAAGASRKAGQQGVQTGSGRRLLLLERAPHKPWDKPVPVALANLGLTPPPGEDEEAGSIFAAGSPISDGENLRAAWEPELGSDRSTAGQVAARLPEDAPAREPRGVESRLRAEQLGQPNPRIESLPKHTAKPQAGFEAEKTENPPASEDGVWKRLQTILRKHAEKHQDEARQAGLESAPEQKGAAAPRQSREAEAGSEVGDIERAGGVKGEKLDVDLEPHLPQQTEKAQKVRTGQVAESSISQDFRAGSEAEQPEQPGGLIELSEKRDREESRSPVNRHVPAERKEAEGEVSAPGSEGGGGRGVRVEPNERVEPEISLVHRTSARGADQEEATTEISGAKIASEGGAQLEEEAPRISLVGDQGSGIEAVEPGWQGALNSLQPMPLEEAWPVERRASPQPRQERRRILPQDTGETSPADIVISQEEHPRVREALREVLPGKPTDSSVEVITPRRRRPRREGEPTPMKEALSVSDQPSDRAVMRRTAEKPGREMEEIVVESPFEEEVEKSVQVETEIGLLPADLWELIGESPRPTQTRAGQTKEPGASLEPIQRESTPAQEGRNLPPGLPGLAMGEVLQRQTAQPGATGDQPTESKEAEKPAERQPGSELDMDELARRVYGEIKNRLAMEWERLRRRI